MLSYKPEELFDKNGKLVPELAALAPKRQSAHGSEPACEWRLAAERFEDAGLPAICGEGNAAGTFDGRVNASAGTACCAT